MSDKTKEPSPSNLYSMALSVAESLGLENIRPHIDLKQGNVSVEGYLSGMKYMVTLSGDNAVGTSSKELTKRAMRSAVADLSAKGLSQTEIATILGVSQPTVSNYLS